MCSVYTRMSLARYDKRRDANEREIITALEKVGCVVYQIDRPVDLIVVRSERTMLMEVKMPGKRPTQEQEDCLAISGGALVYSVDEALAAIDKWLDDD